MKNKDVFLTILMNAMAFTAGAVLAIQFSSLPSSNKGPQLTAEAPFISVEQMQQKLCERGYTVTVDGKLGRETQEAWDRAYIEQCAREACK